MYFRLVFILTFCLFQGCCGRPSEPTPPTPTACSHDHVEVGIVSDPSREPPKRLMWLCKACGAATEVVEITTTRQTPHGKMESTEYAASEWILPTSKVSSKDPEAQVEDLFKEETK